MAKHDTTETSPYSSVRKGLYRFISHFPHFINKFHTKLIFTRFLGGNLRLPLYGDVSLIMK